MTTPQLGAPLVEVDEPGPDTLFDVWKNYQAFERGQGLCYRAENGGDYERADFLALVYGDAQMAMTLFDLCSWQCPETLLDEELSDRCLFGDLDASVTPEQREDGQRNLTAMMLLSGSAAVRARAFLAWLNLHWPFPQEGPAYERVLAFYTTWLDTGPVALCDTENVLIWGLGMVRPDLVDFD